MKAKDKGEKMKNICKMTIIFAALTLAACGDQSDSRTTNTTTNYEVNGKKPDEYFRQFIYRELGECGTIHETHLFPMSRAHKIGVNRDGRDVLAELSLFLKEDGAYFLFYQEIVVFQYTENGFLWDSHQEKTISGRWTVSAGKLVLSNIGEATALQYNGYPAMDLRIDVNLISRGIKGSSMIMRRVESSSMPVAELDPCLGK